MIRRAALKIEGLAIPPLSSATRKKATTRDVGIYSSILNDVSHSGTYLEQSVTFQYCVKTKIPAKSHRLECFCNPL